MKKLKREWCDHICWYLAERKWTDLRCWTKTWIHIAQVHWSSSGSTLCICFKVHSEREIIRLYICLLLSVFLFVFPSLVTTVCGDTLGEFWDYEHQVDLEAFSSSTFYSLLLTQSLSVTTRLGQLTTEVSSSLLTRKVNTYCTLREWSSLPSHSEAAFSLMSINHET